MTKLDRRSVLVLGAAAAAPLAIASRASAAARYGPDEGEEILPGVRQVDLDERDSVIPAYARVVLSDYIFEPGAEIPPMTMPNDMICHMLEGELEVVLAGEAFTAGEGSVWDCAEGIEEGTTNATDSVAIMRVTHLHSA
jgi:quercetin dioxygenase-like cupin family protein